MSKTLLQQLPPLLVRRRMVAGLFQRFIAQCGCFFSGHAAHDGTGNLSMSRWIARELPCLGRKSRALCQGSSVDASLKQKLFNLSAAAAACVGTGKSHAAPCVAVILPWK